MSDQINQALVDLLRSEIESAHAEADAVRSSIRYRLGDVLLQALPLSFRSLGALPQAVLLLLNHRRQISMGMPVGTALSNSNLSAEALRCSAVVFDPELPCSRVFDGVWHTNDEGLLLLRLDTSAVVHLDLYRVTEPIARRVARLQWQGCQIVFCVAPDNLWGEYVQGLLVAPFNGVMH